MRLYMFEWPIFDHLKRVSTNQQAVAVAYLTFWVYLLETLIFDGSEYDLMKSTNLWWYNFPLFHFLQAISSDCRILCLDTLCKVWGMSPPPMPKSVEPALVSSYHETCETFNDSYLKPIREMFINFLQLPLEAPLFYAW